MHVDVSDVAVHVVVVVVVVLVSAVVVMCGSVAVMYPLSCVHCYVFNTNILQLFHPLHLVRSQDTYDFSTFQKFRNNYAKLSDEGSADPKTAKKISKISNPPHLLVVRSRLDLLNIWRLSWLVWDDEAGYFVLSYHA